MKLKASKWLGAALALQLCACASAPTSPSATAATAKSSEFPSREELAELRAKPLPQADLAPSGVAVDRWELAGPLPERFSSAAYPDPSPWGQALAAYAASRAGLVQTTEAMHCVARELGRFVLARGAAPSDELRTFIAGRCGTVATGISMQWFTGQAPAAEPEAQLLSEWTAHTPEAFAGAIGPGDRDAGIWFGRDGAKFITFIASAVRRAYLEPTPRAPDAQQHVVLRGELLAPADQLRTLVNQGAHGYGTCLADRGVTLPRFAITCSVLPTDGETRIQMAAFPAGRVIGSTALDLVAWPQGKGGLVFTRSEAAADGAPSSQPELALLAEVNAVRAQAGQGPLQLAEKESSTSAQLAPYYFAAELGKLEAIVADRVSLGLRAGWDVEGDIRDAEFTAASLAQSNDPARLVAALLASPFGRRVLLDPNAARLAVGEAHLGKTGVGALLTSYALFDAQRDADAARELFARVAAQRAERGLPAPTPLDTLEGSSAQAAGFLRSGDYTPEVALQALFQAAQQKGQRLAGMWMLTSKLDFKVPDALLQPGPLKLSVTVSHQKTLGQPWASYVVLLAYPAPDSLALAARR